MRIRSRSIIPVLAVGATLAGCAAAPSAPSPLPLTELSRAILSSASAARREVVRDPVTWTRVWHEIQDSSGTPPAVDFDGQMVLVACLGERRVGGYSIAIVSASITDFGTADAALQVMVHQGAPTPDSLQAQMITSPCTSARIARTDLPVRWRATD